MFKKEVDTIKDAVHDLKKSAEEISEKVSIGAIILGTSALLTIGYVLGFTTATTIYKFGGKHG